MLCAEDPREDLKGNKGQKQEQQQDVQAAHGRHNLAAKKFRVEELVRIAGVVADGDGFTSYELKDGRVLGNVEFSSALNALSVSPHEFIVRGKDVVLLPSVVLLRLLFSGGPDLGLGFDPLVVAAEAFPEFDEHCAAIVAGNQRRDKGRA